MKPIFKFWAAIGGRKFFAFIAGTGLLIFGKIDQWCWLVLAAAFIGGNVLQKAIQIPQVRSILGGEGEEGK